MIEIYLIESTEYITEFLFVLLLIFPAFILICIHFNKVISFLCKVIEKTGLTLHLVFNL
jgi:hypothetical protein